MGTVSRERAAKLAERAREIYLAVNHHEPAPDDPLLIMYAMSLDASDQTAAAVRDAVDHAVADLPERLAATVSAEALEPVRRTVAAAAATPVYWLKIAVTALLILFAAQGAVIAAAAWKAHELYHDQQMQLNVARDLLNAAATDHTAAKKASAEADRARERQRQEAEAKMKTAAEKKRRDAEAAEKKRKDEAAAAAAAAEERKAAEAQARHDECAALATNYARWGVRGDEFYGIYPSCRSALGK